MFRGSSHCSTSPPSHRRISTISFIQDFPHREPPLRILGNTTLEYTTSLSNNTTSTQEARHNNYHLYTQRDGHLAKTRSTSHQRNKAQSQHSNNQSPLHLEGYQHNLHNHLFLEGYQHNLHNHLSLEGYHKVKKITTLGGLHNRKPNFSHKIRS